MAGRSIRLAKSGGRRLARTHGQKSPALSTIRRLGRQRASDHDGPAQSHAIVAAKDDTTSIAKQDASTDSYANAFNHVIIDTAKDEDISGGISPFKRPKLGPWLTDPELIAKYDGIIAAHIDRLGRNARQLVAFRDWCKDNNKKIITIEPALDWSTPVGELMWFILSWLAEQELNAIKRRTKETFTYLRDNGYLTGKCPFGFAVVTTEVGGKTRKTIAPDEEFSAPIVRKMADRFLGGQTITEICEWLDSEEIKPPSWTAWSKKPEDKRGPEPVWQQNSISSLFRNPVLIGQLESNGDVVSDIKGKPLQRCEPILDDDIWQKLQAKMDATPKRPKSTAPADTSMLTGVLFCAKCGGNMYKLTSTRKHPNGKTYVSAYYRCYGRPRTPSECKNMIRLDDVETRVAEWVMTHKSIEIMETIVVKGNDYGRELSNVTQALEALARKMRSKEITYAQYKAQSASLDAELERLSDLEPEPDRIAQRSTGKTLAREWPAMTDAERRQALLDGEFTVTAVKVDGKPVITVTPGEAYARQLKTRTIPHQSRRDQMKSLATETAKSRCRESDSPTAALVLVAYAVIRASAHRWPLPLNPLVPHGAVGGSPASR